MDNGNLYPFIHAEPLAAGRNVNPQVYYLFNQKENRGYVVEGLAALFCRKLDGKKKLVEVIDEFEAEYELEKGKFENDISELIQDLSKNKLLELLNNPKA